MTDLLEANLPRLSSKQRHGRVLNAAAVFLRDRLSVPNIYLSPRIPGVVTPDLLAVDRAGSGDLYVVEVRPALAIKTRTELRSLVQEAMALPFHYKYIALPEFLNPVEGVMKFAEYPELFHPTGIGRIGFVSFSLSINLASSKEGVFAIKEIIRPERFLVRGEKLVAIEKFLAKTKPDMDVRI